MKNHTLFAQKLGAVTVALTLLSYTTAPLISYADNSNNNQNDKVTICHATNGGHYNQQSVDVNSDHTNGGNNGINTNDIVPPNILPDYPDGLNWEAGEAIYNNGCVAPETPAEPQSCTYVSDATTQFNYGSSVVETPNPAWATIDGASWIWGDVMTDAEAAAGSTDTFDKTFTLTGSGSAVVGLDLASDNGYTVSVNGHLIADQSGNEHAYNPVAHYDIPAADLVEGNNNVLEITVTNLPAGDASINPAGLAYKLSVMATTCGDGTPLTPPGPAPAHITVIKQVVNDGGGTKQASDFTLHVMTTGETPTSIQDFAGSDSGTSVEVTPGTTYTVTEDASPNYTTSYGANCENVTLNAGDEVSCTVTNTYVPPPSCTIVSDTDDQVDGHDAVVLSFIHSSWTHLLDGTGAQWIWSQDGVADPVNATTKVFTKTIQVNGTPDSATVDFATDNGYQLRVNGTLVGGDQLNTEHNYEGTTTLDILPEILPNADNVIEFTVQNLARPNGTLETNPAGLDYAVHINNSSCTVPDPQQTATVVATKIICPTSASFPDQNYHSHTTDANTASSFLAAHPECHLQPGWQFEWGNQNAGDTADNLVGPAGNGYTTSAPTDGNGSVTMTVPLAGLTSIHMREVLQSGFIPFTYHAHTDNSDSGSAQLACGSDGLNYDNWDWINNPEAGHAYYCVAYNAPATSTVTLCKYQQGEVNTPLSGWNLFLKGSHVQDLSVDSSSMSGTDSDPLTAGVSYLALATGTWLNQGGANPVDAEYSTTDGWATHMDGYTGYSDDILETEINHVNGTWGPYNSGHAYAQSFTPAASGSANFGIFDGQNGIQNAGWFGDNSGTIGIGLYQGYAGITSENGCVTFENVPYGAYTLGETGQDGWTNVSGNEDEVTVDQPTETFSLVNAYDGGNEGGDPDLCPNIADNQPTIPEGDILNDDGQCVPADNGDPETTHTEETIVVKAADLATSFADVFADSSKWFFYNDNNDAIDDSLGSFVNGPATAPLGDGSAQITDGATNNRIDLATYQFKSAKLSDIGTLQFSAYSHSGVAGPTESPYFLFNVSFDGTDTWQKRLVYVPANNGSVPQDGWNTYDLINGGAGEWVYSGATWPAGIGEPGTTSGGTPKTWTQILATYPNASLRATDSLMGIRVGEPGPTNYTGNADKIVVGIWTGANLDTKTFDFEPTDMCPNIDGVQTSVPNGKVLVNGNCVSAGGGVPQTSFWSSGSNGEVLGESTTTGEVLGEACGVYMDKFLRFGSSWNDTDQTKKLQAFLNKWMGANLPITGFFGPLTSAAVKAFQAKYADDILKPWGITAPTGLVYFTTLYEMNLLECPSLTLSLPPLVVWSQNTDVSKGLPH